MTVELHIADHVATVTLSRPEAMNAVDLATEARLQQIWTQIETDPSVRVVVLTGAGERAFCAGADLKAINNKERLDTNKGGFAGIVKCAAP